MAATQLSTDNIGSVQRNDFDTTTSGSAVITKVIAGTNISISSTGVDAGTGDVTINATGSGGGDAILAATQTFTGVNTFNSSVTVVGGTAIGQKITGTLTATSSTDTLIGLNVLPTYAGTANATRRAINATGQVLITGFTSSLNTEYPLQVTAPTPTITNGLHAAFRSSETTGAIDTGAAFGFEFNDGSGTFRTAGVIRGMKENGTAGNYASYLSFATRANGASISEACRVTSTKHFLIGTTTDSTYLLDVNGTSRISGATNLANLAGTGTRMVVASSTGDLSTQAIPSGTGGITRSIVTISSNITADSTASTDYVYYVSNGSTITLPTAVGNTNRYTIMRTGTSIVPIVTTSSQLINGQAAPLNLTIQYASVDLMSDGTNWYIH